MSERRIDDEYAHPEQELKRMSNGRFCGIRMSFSHEIERAITERSKYERYNEAMVWLIWIINEDVAYTGVPQLHAICTTEDSVRYQVGALMDQNDRKDELKSDQPSAPEWLLDDKRRFHVERAVCDHAFGSDFLAKAQAIQLFTPPIRVSAARNFDFGGEE